LISQNSLLKIYPIVNNIDYNEEKKEKIIDNNMISQLLEQHVTPLLQSVTYLSNENQKYQKLLQD
jgi:hypothetical protein